ncbi:MAG: hypothetical protein AMS27_10395, partial [Bacteroides sp. SM23_62_1]
MTIHLINLRVVTHHIICMNTKLYLNRCILIFILVMFIPLADLSGQYPGTDDGVIWDKVYNESIKTVQFHRKGWELTYPVIRLSGEDQV